MQKINFEDAIEFMMALKSDDPVMLEMCSLKDDMKSPANIKLITRLIAKFIGKEPKIDIVFTHIFMSGLMIGYFMNSYHVKGEN